MKYRDNLSDKFTEILNNHLNNDDVAFKINNNWTKQIDLKTPQNHLFLIIMLLDVLKCNIIITCKSVKQIKFEN